ncbi:MmcQ/YjbR family DNA-binding protein [Agrobacterium sp. MCAB5]|uniref:MmcQ/YjbR family DNA-binding protein n=1 Tax=Agrobacterium sp. MCAB5 TaxID=3233042 RepID=UPI003F9385AB
MTAAEEESFPMDAKTLAAACTAAEQLPEVALQQAAGSERRVYRVLGKTFMIVTEGAVVTIKADPIRAEILRQRHTGISPGHGMNKRHWVSITEGDTITKDLVEEEVRESYRLVRSKLPLLDELTPAGMRQRSLSGQRLQSLARKVASGLPGVSHGRPFVEKLDVYKVGAKVFLIVTDDPTERIITVKVGHEQRDPLFDRFPSVTAGRYLDKDHWISIGSGKGITSTLVTETVKTSYRLVLKSMAKRERPANSADV